MPIIRQAVLLLLPALAACSALGANGPSTRAMKATNGRPLAGNVIRIVDVDAPVLQNLAELRRPAGFHAILGDGDAGEMRVARGDALAISIYEAPPALLFGPFTRLGSTVNGTEPTLAAPAAPVSLPPVVVDRAGMIAVPFAGSVPVEGRTLPEIASLIRARLARKANDPQVIVAQAGNTSRTVTVIGETGINLRAPLTPHGERLLDVLASAQTLKQSVDKTTIQVARGGTVAAMPLRTILADPAQNVRLQPGDVVTALFKSQSFTALGSVKTNAEVEFETSGITLSQALGRIGGLDDQSANPHGVFVFRFENPRVLGIENPAPGTTDAQGRIPVIYKLDMSKGESIFLAQKFPVEDKDVLYVSRAPLVDIQKFVNVVSQFVYVAINVGNGLK